MKKIEKIRGMKFPLTEVNPGKEPQGIQNTEALGGGYHTKGTKDYTVATFRRAEDKFLDSTVRWDKDEAVYV